MRKKNRKISTEAEMANDKEKTDKELKKCSSVEYIQSLMLSDNYINTHGTIVMKNGAMIRVRRFFEYFREMWNEYKIIEATGTKSELLELLREKTNGGIVSNGEMDICLSDVSLMVSEYKMVENDKRRFRRPPLDDHPELIDD